MDTNDILGGFKESLADYVIAKHLEEISNALNDSADKADDLSTRCAYRIASTKILDLALEWMESSEQNLPTKKRRG